MCKAFPYDLASEVAADLAAVVAMTSFFAVFDGAVQWCLSLVGVA